MMNKKLVNILFTIICIAITVWLVCDYYKGLAINPITPNWIFYLKIGITIIIYVFTYKAVLVSANIVSMLNLIIVLYGTVVLSFLSKLSVIYVTYIVTQPSLIEYNQEWAQGAFEILTYLIMSVMILFWFRYVLIVRHNLAEKQE